VGMKKRTTMMHKRKDKKAFSMGWEAIAGIVIAFALLVVAILIVINYYKQGGLAVDIFNF
jgi:hypothetical protein